MAHFTKDLAVKGGQEKQIKRRITVTTNRMIALTAGMALAVSMMASATTKAPAAGPLSRSTPSMTSAFSVKSVLAREQEPGDDRGKDRRKDDKGKDGRGHKFASTIAREQEPKDDKGKHKKGEGTGHKLVNTIAREQEPGDDHGKDRRKDDKGKDGKGHKFATVLAREQQPKDDRGKDKNHKDGAGHKLVQRLA